ncbi:MAG: hypothetical protein KatS3mg060_3082 [Dehalococcoidia bacterium]|nr:MAG: hypothetical protein KatS3mg060_3082 [Dehalococcoidia bacterium]
MASTPRDFGPVVRLEAESQGPPGRRTFRLLIANEYELASLWIEKEQLQALGLAIEQLLAQMDENAGEGTIPSGVASSFETIDAPVGRLGLGFDEASDLFVVVVYLPETGENDTPDFVCRASRAMMKKLSSQIEEIVAAGRPRCPLCGAPINPDGHVCVRSNGHFSMS